MRDLPPAECDIVMKGGITSGVVYPLALQEFGRHYRLRGVGGSSAGAIGAALGAAAEFNRGGGGYDELEKLPAQLGEGRLRELFVPAPGTRATLRVLLAAVDTEHRGPGKIARVLAALVGGHPLAAVAGALPGLALLAVGLVDAGAVAGTVLAVLGLVLAVLGALLGAAYGAWRELTGTVVRNLFGICRGLGNVDRIGFTDWLAERIDTTAGMPEGRTLTFGDLWDGPVGATGHGDDDKYVDLQMMTTCLSEGRPYQLPTDAGGFYYDPAEWRTLFPDYVMDALAAAPEPWAGVAEDKLTAAQRESRWEAAAAARHQVEGRPVRLRRLPPARHLPVVVATRMSLSFPLLISMIPLYTVDWRSERSRLAKTGFRSGRPDPSGGLVFNKLWFSDGGLCSNFPVHLFDSALPTRPTFAINLGRVADGQRPDPGRPEDAIEYSVDNFPLLPDLYELPTHGAPALFGFAAAAVNTARNWQDNSHLNFPGYRDRIVRVLQTREEGGLNLAMDTEAIDLLSARGRTAAEVMVRQFNQPTYPYASTGWDNHRWVRYRALLAALPPALASFRRGLDVVGIDQSRPPSFEYRSQAERAVAQEVTDAMAAAADVVLAPEAATRLARSAPRPIGMIRRIPPL